MSKRANERTRGDTMRSNVGRNKGCEICGTAPAARVVNGLAICNRPVHQRKFGRSRAHVFRGRRFFSND